MKLPRHLISTSYITCNLPPCHPVSKVLALLVGQAQHSEGSGYFASRAVSGFFAMFRMTKILAGLLRGSLLLPAIIVTLLLSGCERSTDTGIAATNTTTAPMINNPVINDEWWLSGKAALKQRLAVKPSNHQAKNVILFIGDGMGISTVTAARIFDGQSRGQSGEENVLSFEHFPHVALIKTYNTDAQVPDSAGTASAMNTGVKTRFMAVSIWADQPVGDCFGPQKNFPRTLAEMGETIGMSTAVVTTDKVTHATPAAVYAHSPSRNWENDATMPAAARLKGCQDIAQQLVNFPYGDGLDVIMGGGRESLLPQSKGGKRLDNQDLIARWQQRYPEGRYVQSASELRALTVATKTGDANNTATAKLLALFAPRRLAYSVDDSTDQEPTLAEMTSTAIDLLSSNPKGYFLMVENGHIDHAHHKNNAYRALSATQAFAQAISAALAKVDLNETLLLVTADHSHPLTISGYPERGNPILGLVEPVGPKGGVKVVDGFAVGIDEQPYTTLGYRVGPDTRASSAPLSAEVVAAVDYKQQAAIPMGSGHHGGEDVALYAIGPQSHLVGGVLEQNVIFHIISEALGWNVKD